MAWILTHWKLIAGIAVAVVAFGLGTAAGFKLAAHGYVATITRQAAIIGADKVQADSATAALAAQTRATATAVAQAASARQRYEAAVRGAQASAEKVGALDAYYRDQLAKAVASAKDAPCPYPLKALLPASALSAW